MSQLSFDVIKRVWPKSGLVTLFKKYSRFAPSARKCRGIIFGKYGRLF